MIVRKEEKINSLAEKYVSKALEMNRFLAKHPELGSQEYKALNKITSILEEEGIPCEKGIKGIQTAFLGKVPSNNKSNKYRVAILVEYDALPGIGHGCGHSASGAISILAGLILKDLIEDLPIELHILGTPDEEINGGKIMMDRLNVFDDYDLTIMMHMHHTNQVHIDFMALDGLTFEFKGKSSHASASPWEGRNALNAARILFQGIDMMRQHIKPSARIHGIIKEGGLAPNIVPDYTRVEMYTRDIERESLDDITEWIIDCAKAGALATRTELKVGELCPSLKDLKRNSVGETYLEEAYIATGVNINRKSEDTFGSSDIGHPGYRCPTFHPVISIGDNIDLHTEEFAKAMFSEKTERAIRNGGEIIARFIYEVFSTKGAYEKIFDEFKEKLNE